MGPRRYRRGCPELQARYAQTLLRASMGPRRYRRGCAKAWAADLIAKRELQWGRDVTVADVIFREWGPIYLTGLQWGRDVTVADVWAEGLTIGQLGFLLQWGRDVTVADVGFASKSSGFQCAASMGPRRYRRGCSLPHDRSARHHPASMGPRRYRRGCPARPARPQARDRDASMGPRRYRRGCWLRSVRVGLRRDASMGPRRYRRGCRVLGSTIGSSPTRLQWGRDVTVADVSRAPSSSTPTKRTLQWGRDVTVADVKFDIVPASRPGHELQWGRDVTVADVPTRSTSGLGWTSSFNGAATLPSRMLVLRPLINRNETWALQWGRDVTVADVGSSFLWVEQGASGFNGAATLPSRMYDREPARASDVHRFNGAATLPSRMCCGLRRRSCVAGWASMGPRRYRRGCFSGQVDWWFADTLQWGRDVTVADV